MNEIIQTEVDKDTIFEIYVEIKQLESDIDSLNKRINYLRDKKSRLNVTHFCGKKIISEREGKHFDLREYYKLVVQVLPYNKVNIEAYRSARDMTSFVSLIKGSIIKNNCMDNVYNIQYDIKTFEEAKQICRQLLADLIYNSCQEDDING